MGQDIFFSSKYYLIFCSNEKYFRVFTNTSKVLSWKSKEFSDEIL